MTDGDSSLILAVDDLVGLSDSEFDRYVTDHLHDYMGEGAPGHEAWAVLSDPQIVARTREVLVIKHQRVNDAIVRRTEHRRNRAASVREGSDDDAASIETDLEFQEWHDKAVRFRRQIQGKLALTRSSKRKVRRAAGDSRTYYRDLVRQLSIAIERHRQSVRERGIIPEISDRELWRVLDRLTVPHGPNLTPTPLSDMLEHDWCDP